MKSKGFSMIELLIVIVIVGLIAGIAILQISSTNSYVQTTAKEQLIQVLRTARAEAIARDKYVTFACINSSTQNLFVLRQLTATYSKDSTGAVDSNGNIKSNIIIGSQYSQKDIKVDFCSNLKKISTDADVWKEIVFDPQGRVADDNVVNTANPIKISITVKGVSKDVTIVKGTGYIY